MNDQHIFNLKSDYVLDLLSGAERQQVEQHIAACAHCRDAIMRERQVGQAVRATLTAASWPSSERLRQFMPVVAAVPRRESSGFTFTGLARSASLSRALPITAVCLLLLLFSSFGLGWPLGAQPGSEPANYMAATSTAVPTLAATHTIIAVTGTAVSTVTSTTEAAHQSQSTLTDIVHQPQPEPIPPAPTPGVMVAMYSR